MQSKTNATICILAFLMSQNLVIIPTYNEIENIEKMVRKVFSLKRDFHLLIVDDGSPDGTAEKVNEDYKKRYIVLDQFNFCALVCLDGNDLGLLGSTFYCLSRRLNKLFYMERNKKRRKETE